jgi:hypothetical protein
LSGREALLKGRILSLPGPIDQKPADKPRTRPGGRTEPGIAADSANYRATAGANRSAGQRALLGWSHIGAGGERHSGTREQQYFFHRVPQMSFSQMLFSEMAGKDNAR